MFLCVCKQTLHRFYRNITWEFLGSRMPNFQGNIFIWIKIYREIFKSALVYLLKLTNRANFGNRQVCFPKLLGFFSEEGLTIDYFYRRYILSKLQNTHFWNLNNKPWCHYDIIILKKQLFSLENWTIAATKSNFKFRYQKLMWDFIC